jgi:hypothetical protein
MTEGPLINNLVKMKLLLEFEVAFPEEQPKTVKEYLEGGTKELILNAAAFFLGFKNQKSKFDSPREALEMFFRKENNRLANQIYDRIKVWEKEGKQVQIFNVYTSLKLFEIFFNTDTRKETQTEAEFEVNLFKAILVLNSEYTKKQKIAFESTKDLDKELRFPMMLFCSFYQTSDKMNYNIYELWTTQFIKAIYLFQLLEREKQTQPLLSSFLAYFNCSTWEEYLKRLLPLTFSFLKTEREAHTDIIVEHGDNFQEDCAFLEKLIVKEEDELEADDFLPLRSKPFYKIKDGVYRIIFGLFVVEKIFKGAYFILRDINDKLPKQYKIADLKSFFGEEFSEKVLTYEILKVIYPEKCIAYTGKELMELHVDGAPDYYIRKGKDILLFESKDFLIPAAAKDSFDFSIYELEFEKKLYFAEKDGVEKPKAVKQLINSVRKLLKNDFKVDKDYQYKEASIYPILITHDQQYDVAGFNHLINYWFQAELEQLATEGFFIHRIKPIVIVNIDCLIYHQVALQKHISLHEALNLYTEHIKINRNQKFKNQSEVENYLMSKMTPFPIFFDDYVNDKGWREMPPMLHDFGLTLFKINKQNDNLTSAHTAESLRYIKKIHHPMRQSFKKIRSLDWTNYPTEDVNNLIIEFGKIPYMITDYDEGKIIHRACRISDDEIVNNISRLTYRPQESNTTYQRASIPQKTMFYGAVIPQEMDCEDLCFPRVTSAMETCKFLRNTKLDGKQRLLYGKWIVKSKISLITILFTRYRNARNNWIKTLGEYFYKNIESYSYEERKKYKQISNFLSDEFSKYVGDNEDYKYLISSIFANDCTEKNLDGVLYPSVRTMGLGLNVAIKPTTVNDKMELISVLECEVYKRKKNVVINNLRFCEVASGSNTFNLEEITDPNLKFTDEQIEDLLNN